jgi:hypothetical protein
MDDLRLLQQPPAKDEAATKTLNILNSRLPSWESLLKSPEFDVWVEHSQADATALKAQVSVTSFQGLEILMHTSSKLLRRC